MKNKPHEKTKEFVAATQGKDIEKASAILQTILDDKLQDRYTSSRKALEEA
jgi:hypothetical protein